MGSGTTASMARAKEVSPSLCSMLEWNHAKKKDFSSYILNKSIYYPYLSLVTIGSSAHHLNPTTNA
jgi:hypothetical protein